MIISNLNTTIVDCYVLTDEEINEKVNMFYEERKSNSLLITRSKTSYKREIKAHKRLYKIGFWRSKTKDADLEENIDWWKEIVYTIIGF